MGYDKLFLMRKLYSYSYLFLKLHKSRLPIGSAHTRKLSQSSVEQYVPSFGHSPTMAASSKRRTRHKLRPETTLKPGGRELDSKDWMSENRSQYPLFADEAFKQKLVVTKNLKNQSSVMSDLLTLPKSLQ